MKAKAKKIKGKREAFPFSLFTVYLDICQVMCISHFSHIQLNSTPETKTLKKKKFDSKMSERKSDFYFLKSKPHIGTYMIRDDKDKVAY